MPPDSPAPKKSNEYRSLESTRACVQASIAARVRRNYDSPEHRNCIAQERARLMEIEAEMKRIDAANFTALLAEEKKVADEKAAGAQNHETPAPAPKSNL